MAHNPTDARGGDGLGNKPLLRSVIDHNGQPSTENLNHNFERLQKSRYQWGRPDDERLFAWISRFYEEHGEAPNVSLLIEAFPDDRAGDLEVAERIKDVTAPNVPIYIRTNFAAKLKACLDEQRDVFAFAIVNRAKDILSKRAGVEIGTGRDKKTLKGFDDFATYLLDEIARLKTETSSEKTITTLGAAEIFAPLPTISWTCEGLRLSPLVGVIMFAGYGDSGKSIVAQHIALCVAAGLPVFGVHSVTQGRVLHLDYEQGRFLTCERYQRLGRERGIDVEKLMVDDRLRLGVFPKEKLDDKGVDEILAETIKGFDVLIVDSNRAASPGTDENSSEARVPLDMISRVCAGKVLPLIIHHARKPTQEGTRAGGGPRMAIRGSSALFDALGGCFVFEGGKERSDPVRIFHEKERLRGVRLDPFAFRIVDVAGESDPRWGLRVEVLPEDEVNGVVAQRVEFQNDCRTVLRVIVGHPGFALKRIRTTANFGESRAMRCLQHLLDSGHIEEREGKTSNNRLATLYFALKEAYEPPGPGFAVENESSVNGFSGQSADEFIGEGAP